LRVIILNWKINFPIDIYMPSHIHNIPMGLANAFLIEGENALVLVDAGSPGFEQKVFQVMHKLKRDDLSLIYITHAHLDHYGSAAALRRTTGASIATHKADGETMAKGETPLGSVRGRGKWVNLLFPILSSLLKPEMTAPDILLEDGDDLTSFGLEGFIVHTPGHTPGSSCLILDGEIAFVGDLISNTGGPHLQRYFAHDWGLLPSSLSRLQAESPEWVYPGHGPSPIGKKALLGM
jgi:glyoxylase-like metal-dependent hydrolase (beta-lactamase superfamily II)